MIYADNAATTRMHPAAIQAMTACMAQLSGNPSSLHTPGRQAKRALEDARTQLADLLGCTPRELVFTSGGTEANNLAIFSAARLGAGKRHIVSTVIEHHAVLAPLEALKKQGFEITLLDVPENGILNPGQLAQAIRPDTCLVSVMYANNEIGTIQPISELAALCRRQGVLFHTDAVQAVGQIPVDLKGVDLLSLSAHKFRGPVGVGALYVRRGVALEPLLRGGEQERGRRAGTENLPAIAGMAAALENAYTPADRQHLAAMRDRLIDGLSAISGSVLNGDRQNRLPGNVSFCFDGIVGEALLLLLDRKGIFASTGAACASGNLDPSHVLLALGRPKALAYGALRLTPDASITPSEVDAIVEAVTQAVSHLRGSAPEAQGR